MPRNKSVRFGNIFSQFCVLLLFTQLVFVSQALAWWSISPTLIYGTTTHQQLFINALNGIPSSEYPDIYMSYLNGLLEAGSNSEAAHYTADVTMPADTQYWYGNEQQWRDRAVTEYTAWDITDAYTHIGYVLHLRQDSFVPAHNKVIPHGKKITYLLQPLTTLPPFTVQAGFFPILDDCELYAALNYDDTGPEYSIDTLAYDKGRDCSSKFWYSATEEPTPDPIEGTYGRTTGMTGCC